MPPGIVVWESRPRRADELSFADYAHLWCRFIGSRLDEAAFIAEIERIINDEN